MSYQKDDGKGSYTPIGNGNGSNGHSNSSTGGKSRKYWIIAAVVVLVTGIVLVATLHKPTGKATEEAMSQADLPVSEDGSLMLFDERSK